MGAMVSQITSISIVYSTVCWGSDKKNPSKLRVTGLCEGNSPVTSDFPSQRASNAENVSIGWRHNNMCANDLAMLEARKSASETRTYFVWNSPLSKREGLISPYGTCHHIMYYAVNYWWPYSCHEAWPLCRCNATLWMCPMPGWQ